MTTRAFLIGLSLSLLGIAGTYAYGYQHPASRFILSAGSLSYIVYSLLAFLVSRVGVTTRKKGWIFFSFGIALLFSYLAAIDHVVEFFYWDALFDYKRDFAVITRLRLMHEAVMWSFIIVASLSIFRGISLWSSDNPKA